MGYTSLTAPHEEFTEESDDSIQGSPLLDTSTRFSAYMDGHDDSQLEAHDSVNGIGLQETQDEKSSVETKSDGYTSLPNSFPLRDSNLRRASYGQLRDPMKEPRMSPVFEEQPINEAPNKTFTEEPTIIRRRSMSPQRARIQNRNSMLPKLGDAAFSDKMVHSSLNFDINQQRPKSTFIDGSFSNSNIIGTRPTAEEEEDMLPFEETKQMAWKGRPKSMAHLSSLSNGPVISRETFENYRKSIGSLGMLKHMSSTGSFRSMTRHANNHDAKSDDEEIGEEDGLLEDDDSTTNEQTQKRMSAKLRQEQDARMSIYRQRMTKIIGGSPDVSISMGNNRITDGVGIRASAVLEEETSDDEGDLEDIPLSILQAHHFPKDQIRKSMGSIHEGCKSSNTSLSPQQPPHQSTSPRPTSMSGISLMHNSPSPAPPGERGSYHFQNNSKNQDFRLPPVFGNKDGMLSRGLVNEIAKEEEYRKRRQTFGFTNVMEAPNGWNTTQPSSTVPRSATTQPNELQQKLDQVLDMLTKLSTEGGSLAGTPLSGSINPTPAWAHQRAPSIRSAYTAQSTPSNLNIMSGPLSDFPPPFIPFYGGSPQPGQPMMCPPQVHMSQFPPTHPPNPLRAHLPPVRGPQQSRTVSNRPSRMRIVNDNDDSDDDDDTEWEKLMEKRKSLREQWKHRQEVPST